MEISTVELDYETGKVSRLFEQILRANQQFAELLPNSKTKARHSDLQHAPGNNFVCLGHLLAKWPLISAKSKVKKPIVSALKTLLSSKKPPKQSRPALSDYTHSVLSTRLDEMRDWP